MPEGTAQFHEGLNSWADDHLRDYPWRQEEIPFYEVFLAEFLLVQTPADRVAEFLPEFVEAYPDFDAVADAPESEVATALEPLGLQHRRAKALKEIAKAVDGKLPRDAEELRDLSRVGPYIADATMMYAEGEDHALLDTNIRRVYSRLLGDKWPAGETDQRELALQLVEESPMKADVYNLALLDFGALVCKARSPRCEDCFASNYCDYYQS